MMVMMAATLCAHGKFNDDDDADGDGGELGAAAVVDDDDADGDGGELGAAAVVAWCVCCKGCLYTSPVSCKGCLYTSPVIFLYTMHQTSSWRRSCAIMRVFRIQTTTKTAAATAATPATAAASLTQEQVDPASKYPVQLGFFCDGLR